MRKCSFQPRDRIFVKSYGFLSFAKKKGKNISKNLNGKYIQKLLDHTNNLQTHVLKTTSRRVIQKTAEANGDLIRHKIANKITEVSRNSQQNNSETIANENDKEIPKERYISPEKKSSNY